MALAACSPASLSQVSQSSPLQNGRFRGEAQSSMAPASAAAARSSVELRNLTWTNQCSPGQIRSRSQTLRRSIVSRSGQASFTASLSLCASARPLSNRPRHTNCPLQSSFTPSCSSYVCLSSHFHSRAVWASFGLQNHCLHTLSRQRHLRAGRKGVVTAYVSRFEEYLWSIKHYIVAAALALAIAFSSFAFVPSGSVGIRTTLGQVERQVLAPGLHFNYPVIGRIHWLTTKTQLIVADESDVPTKEGLVVELDVSILHSIEPAKAADLFITVGPDYVDKLILPELHSAVANITSEYNAKALYTDARAQLTQELRQYLQDKLGHKGIVIEDVLLRAIKLPEQLTKAIQDKLRTEQEAQRMEFVLLKEQQEAERKRIEAEGISTFQKIVSEGISPQLLQWKGIEATQELAKSPNAKIVVIGNAKDGLPLILGGADDVVDGSKRK